MSVIATLLDIPTVGEKKQTRHTVIRLDSERKECGINYVYNDDDNGTDDDDEDNKKISMIRAVKLVRVLQHLLLLLLLLLLFLLLLLLSLLLLMLLLTWQSDLRLTISAGPSD